MSRHYAAPTKTENGARVELRLETNQSSESKAVYDLRLFEGGDEEPRLFGEGQASVERVEKGAAPTTVEVGAELPEWLNKFIVTLLRGAARASGPWPRRITRWRNEGGGKD